MLEIKNLDVWLAKKPILESVSFAAAPGRISAVIGPNGAGKSTLIKSVMNLVKIRRGQILWHNRDLTGFSRKALAKTVAYLPQNSHPVPSKVYDSVLLGRKPHLSFRPGQDDRRMVDEIIEDLNLGDLKDSCVTKISGGEFQKSLIARLLVQNVPVMLLDEPINHLDVKNQLEIMELVQGLTVSRKLVSVIVLHDLNFAMGYADELLLLKNGKIVFSGPPEKLSVEKLKMAYQVDLKIVPIDGKLKVIF
ncbi:MAG: ABC transporter ATP-binding protein [Deltaproteobacteria bacterium]|jgi:iron complex transport system ATP-binding protein|nr:ABC transporter ATP-binding protein [Deltaproteobacteria bacterium]